MPSDEPPAGADFRAIFAAVPGPLLVLTPELIMVAANRDRFTATMTTSDTIGRPLFDLFPDNPEDPATEGVRNLVASLDRVKATLQPDSMPVQKYDIPRPESEGGGFVERYWSPVNTPVVVDGELRYIIHGVADVTEYVRMEQQGTERAEEARELQGQKQQMAAEILARQKEVADASRQLKEINVELSGLYEKSVELDRAKSEFFANVSHELRTPLALILGRAERLAAESGSLTPAAMEQVTSIRANAQVLLQQVNDLLEAATMESGRAVVEWRDLDLASLVRRVAGNFESAAVDAGLTLSVDLPLGELRMQGDQRRLAGALGNLLANGIKFTPAGGLIRTGVRTSVDDVLIEVADSGPGIPEHQRETVFERFRQGDGSQDRLFGGTGLGLSLVKDTAELHHGRVEIATAPEGGALFRLRLPRTAPAGVAVAGDEGDQPAAEQAAQALAAQQRIATFEPAIVEWTSGEPDGRPTLLLVEDNADLAAFVAEDLRFGYRILHAPDGLVALDTMASQPVDLVLTDLMMPRMDGEALLTEMKSDPRYAHIPVVVLTARSDPDVRIRMLEQGATDFLSKPFSTAELRARVSNVADAAGLRMMLESQVAERTTERDEAKRRLAHIVTHDALTDLPNRIYMMELVQRQVAADPDDVGVLLVNVDDLQRINDAMGHAVGDQILLTVAERLRRRTQLGDVVARIGGDEFVVAVRAADGPDELMDIASRILRELAEPIDVSGEPLVATASIGVSSLSDHGSTAEALVREAEFALPKAKGAGKNRFFLFDESLQLAAESRWTTEQALRRALRLGELRIHYQPERNMRTGAIHGFEALLRWLHPDRGLTLPGDFLPVAKAAGLMPEIDQFVLATACRDCLAWEDLLLAAGGRVWINLSADLLRRKDMPSVVFSALAEAGASAELIGIEITETLAMDEDLDVEHFRELVRAGVQIAIDDFGTGYSSLASLKYFPASVLKLDQSLIADVSDSTDASSIARAAIDLGHTLGLDVLAEGVETAAQLQHLADLDCDIGQGWHLGVPSPMDGGTDTTRRQDSGE